MSRIPPYSGVLLALAVSAGCTLLTPYPQDDLAFFLKEVQPGDIPNAEDDLVNPEQDPTISVRGPDDPIVAFPGEPFTVSLDFTAENRNVIGGGISFGSELIQWTLLPGLEERSSGNISFGYIPLEDICARANSNMCDVVPTYQFAVGRGDDGNFVVSPPAVVDVVFMCAECWHETCIEALGDSCRACPPADSCNAFHDDYIEGNSSISTGAEAIFNLLFGPNGEMWKTDTGCTAGAALCEEQNLFDTLVCGG